MNRFFQMFHALWWLVSMQETQVTAAAAAAGGRHSSSALAFVQQQSRTTALSTTRRRRQGAFFQHQLYIDPTNNDFSPEHNRNSNKKSMSDKQQEFENNEWGIPHHSTLEPLGPTGGSKLPPDQLPNGGRVTLVGAGPGDPDLLTVAAYKLLTQNPNAVIISDRLVAEEVLDLIPNDCEIKIARKLPGCAELAQEEIFSWVHQGLKRGKHVIRLKIGDPFVFGRGGEEVLVFRDFGVEAKVVPGVSSAFSAPLLGSIPVTHRGVAQQVVMCTGYGREGTSPDLIQYHKQQTVVFLMAVGRLRELCQRLIDLANYPPQTPVAIVERAGCPNQRTVVGNLLTIADVADQHQVKPPSTIVVGEVVNVLLEKDDSTGETITGLIQNMTSTSAILG